MDNRISKGRSNLYGLFGAGFAYKSFLSPVVKLHLFRTYTVPILKCGLCTFVLRPGHIETLSLFQRKTLKSILMLSENAPTPSIHFLTGELPIEGQIHRDVFSIFYSIWSNPDTKIAEIVRYLLKHVNEKSNTWCAYLIFLSRRYGLDNPSSYLNVDPPSRSVFKELVATKIACFFERELRQKAENNSLMKYLNVSTLGLRGRRHIALSNLSTSYSVKIARPHLKFLSGNYITQEIIARQSKKGSPTCKVCQSGDEETVCHIICSCEAYDDQRKRVFIQFSQLCKETVNSLEFEHFLNNEEQLCQFIIDPTSLNLTVRVSFDDPRVDEFFKLSRDFCFIIDKTRKNLLKALKPTFKSCH